MRHLSLAVTLIAVALSALPGDGCAAAGAAARSVLSERVLS
jgi:hypothetical protein